MNLLITASLAPNQAHMEPASCRLSTKRNWQGTADFVEAYVNGGGYAYTRSAAMPAIPFATSSRAWQ